MTRIRSRLLILTSLAMFLTTLSLPALAAGKPILEMIPKEVAGFVVLSDLARADEAVATLSAKSQMPIPGPIMILKMATGLGDVIDTKGSMAALYFNEEESIEEEEASTPVVFLLPVSDFEKLLATFEEPKKVEAGIYQVTMNFEKMLLTSKDGYALFAPAQNRKQLDEVLTAKDNVVEEMQPWKAWVDSQVFYAAFTQSGLQMTRAQIAASMEKGNVEKIDVLETEGEVKASVKLEAKVLQGNVSWEDLLSAYDSIKLLAAGAKVDDSGVIRMTFRCGMTPDSKLSKLLGEIQPAPKDLLASLPQGPFMFAGGGSTPKGLEKLFSTVTGDAMLASPVKEGDSPPAFQFESYRASLQSQSLFIGPPQGEQSMPENICAISRMSSTEKAFANINKDAEAIRKWFMEMEKEMNKDFGLMGGDDEEEEEEEETKDAPKEPSLFKVLTKETTIDGYKTLIVTYDLSGMFEKMIGGMGGMVPFDINSMFEKFYGKDFKINEYNILLDEHQILSTYCNDPKVQKQLIKIATTKTGGLAENDDIKKVLTMLPADAQWKYFWSPGGTAKLADWYLSVMKEAMQGMIPIDKLPVFPKSLPVGMAGVTSKELVEFTVVVPPDTLRGSFQYYMQMQALIGSLQGGRFQ